MIVHHGVAFLNYYLAFWHQDFTIAGGTAFIFLEISGPFVNGRWLMFDHGIGSGTILQTINTVLLFFTFMFGRVVFQIFLVFTYCSPWVYYMLYDNPEVTTTYKIILCEMSLAIVINMILNFGWAWLIIRQVIRIITRGS